MTLTRATLVFTTAAASDLPGQPGPAGAKWDRRDICAFDTDGLLAQALRSCPGTHFVLLNTTDRVDEVILNAQLKHVVAEQIDACFAFVDPLVLLPEVQIVPAFGTLILLESLKKVTDLGSTGTPLWSEFVRKARFGALPGERHIAQPVWDARAARDPLAEDAQVRACVDSQWYRKANPDVAASDLDATTHYLDFGWRERRNPSRWFDTGWYLDHNPQVLHTQTCPLTHFLVQQKVTYPLMRPGFDLRWYIYSAGREGLSRDELLLNSFVPDFRHLYGDGASEVWRIIEGFAPQLMTLMRAVSVDVPELYSRIVSLIDADWYRRTYPDCGTMHPAEHYLCFAWRDGRNPNAWFDTRWYLSRNGEAAQCNYSALEHFVRHSAGTGADPHPGFDSAWYTRRYMPGNAPASGSYALWHFLSGGAAAGNVPHPRLDRAPVHEDIDATAAHDRCTRMAELYRRLPDEAALFTDLIDIHWYRQLYGDVPDPVSHYLQYGLSELLDPNPWFDAAWYVEQYPSALKSGLQPLLHFIRTGAFEGMRPSLAFDHVWYGKRHLGAHSPTPDALLHFLGTGAGTPHPELDRPDLLAKLLPVPFSNRPPVCRLLLRKLHEDERLVKALVDDLWYRESYGFTGVSAVDDYRDSGWREGRNPNRWFDTRWYLYFNPDVRAQGSCPLEHFVRVGARQGRDPHPLFRVTWYSRHYLGCSETGAQALSHFMNIGINNGCVPDPRLTTPAVEKRLRQIPADRRPDVLGRLAQLLYRAQHGPVAWSSDDAQLWSILLTRQFAESTVAVLLLFEHNPEAAEVAAMALPDMESPVFGRIQDDTICLSDSVGPNAAAVALKLPDEIESLRTLLKELPCRRAAVLDRTLLEASVSRYVRNADVPVFGR